MLKPTGRNKLWLLCVLLPCAAAAETPRQVYFSRSGDPVVSAVQAAYLREYRIEGAAASAQDFYYPSRRKYSDPYTMPLQEARRFVPKLHNGTLVLWYENGRKKMEAPYRNGQPHGEWKNWFDNGNMSALMPYRNGKVEGVGARFYRNGEKESEIRFSNDKANGQWRQWYEGGRLKSEILMRDDKPVYMQTWDEAGRITGEMDLSRGRNGVVLEWYPDGSKRSESVYLNDSLSSRTEWDENGNPLDE
ncbi:toxin-antitoxin system YwqK family antitoxin [Neisseria leonii]|uniref:Toxin-antitoxin system YwqK family antitoxin n=1 Tax=Neisseria leonii TaxID=2995413 RepID=A0A9X4IAP8_9NEIS|nr:toxin-antitoxin system YwqK family antitoxin [Neisseria sp. 51.81]MDD9327594.1 toxin-antitoxin system YwqK family antitoxin [Neisseria sp. 51.81]